MFFFDIFGNFPLFLTTQKWPRDRYVRYYTDFLVIFVSSEKGGKVSQKILQKKNTILFLNDSTLPA